MADSSGPRAGGRRRRAARTAPGLGLGCLAACALALLRRAPPRAFAAPPKAAELLSAARGDAAKMEQAFYSIKDMADADSGDAGLKLSAAEAAVSLMRIASHANSLACRLPGGGGPKLEKQDTSANMKLWSEWAPVAQALLGEAEAALGDAFERDPSSFILSVEANMYATSSKGIVAAVTSGKALSFLASVAKLEKLHPQYDGAIYCIYWGAYYLAAPWPMSSTSKARKYLERSVKAYPRSRRNQYWGGVAAFADGDYAAARGYMERALEEECASPSEQDICDWMAEEARRTLEALPS